MGRNKRERVAEGRQIRYRIWVYAARWLVGVTMLLALAGGAGSVSAAANYKVTVWWDYDATMVQQLSRFENDFKSKNPDLDVKIVFLPHEGYENKMLAGFAGRTAGDVVDAFGNNFAMLYDLGGIIPLDKYVQKWPDKANFSPELLKAKTYDGHLLAIPFNLNSTGLYIRKDWLKKLGLAPPRTWDEYYKVTYAFTYDDPDGNGRNDTYGLNFRPPAARVVLPWVFQQGGDFIARDGKRWIAPFDTEAHVKAVEFLKKLWDAKVIRPDSLTDSKDDFYAAFMSGQSGSCFYPDYTLERFKKALGDKLMTLEPLVGKQRATLVQTNDVVINAASKNQDAAWRYIQWFVSKDTTLNAIFGFEHDYTRRGFNFAARTDIDYAGLRNDPLLAPFQEVSLQYGHFMPVHPKWGLAWEEYVGAVTDILLGKVSVREGLRRAAEKATKELNS